MMADEACCNKVDIDVSLSGKHSIQCRQADGSEQLNATGTTEGVGFYRLESSCVVEKDFGVGGE
jgi:hypothetical protein